MIPASAKVLIAIGWSAAMFGAGWTWRGDRAEAKESVTEMATIRNLRTVEQQARAEEQKKAQIIADIGEKHETDRSAASELEASVVAGLRSGNIRLRDDLATCRLSSAAAVASGSGERHEGAELRAEVAAAAIRAGRDADDQLAACQAVIRADRAP